MLLGEAATRARAIDRAMAEDVLARVAGSGLIGGNAVRLLRDGAENYPAWLDAIAAAERTVHVETYYIRDDEIGRTFADALAAKARQGVAVRVLYDWLGAYGKASRRMWRRLAEAGVRATAFNPPRLDSPLGILSRDHRKYLGVDGRVGFVAGLCIADDWVGGRHPPWRDTGIELRGPAVAELEAAFARSWAAAGGPLPEPPSQDGSGGPAGALAVRVIESQPNTLGLYRFDQLIAAAARRSLWLTDAYFVGTTGYVQALCEAARDGVDVRLLVPSATDIPVIKNLSRAGYRPLLEAGIRVFEWNGPMLHAKTAVADGRWARVGSSNLNLASWIGNWELDVAIEDEAFAREMEAMYAEDLANATEIVLDVNRVHAAPGDRPSPLRRPGEPRHPARHGAGRAAAGALGIGSAVGAAITNRRALGPAEAKVLATGGVLLLLLAALGAAFPLLFMVPLAVLGAWIGGALLIRAWRLSIASRSAKKLPPRLPS